VHRNAEKYLRNNIRSVLIKYYNNDVFSASSLAVSRISDERCETWYENIGRYGENDRFEIDETARFDLASLTKPLVTLPCVLHLIDSRTMSWDDSLENLLERDVPESFRDVELQNLLSHNAGFGAHEEYWRVLKSMRDTDKTGWLLDQILYSKPAYSRGSRHVYSDLGYLLLGLIVEIKSGLRLDRYWSKHVAIPLGIQDNLLFPADSARDGQLFVPTGTCTWSGVELAGVVHDDNSRSLGGVTGHAGLFGSAEGVLSLCKEYLLLHSGRQGSLQILPETFKRASTRVNKSEWTCGFNLPSVSGSSSGRFFSKQSFGHLGFTGVSFWVDTKNRLIVILLTNRVIKGECKKGIQAMRPEIHDTVVSCLRE